MDTTRQNFERRSDNAAQNTKVLRPKVGVRALCVVIYLAGIVLWAMTVPEGYRLWVIASYAVIGAFWLADMFLTRIVLQTDRVFILANFRSRAFPRAEIDSVTWEKGGGAAMQLRDGTWVRLPNVGQTPQGLTAKIRAWLKKTEIE